MTAVMFLARHPVAGVAVCAVLIVASSLVICLAAAAEADAVGVDS